MSAPDEWPCDWPVSAIDEIERQAERADAAEAELAEARAEVERALTLLTEDLSVLRMGPSDKGFTLETAGRMVAIIAGELATWLREHEAKNYTETTFEQIEVSGGASRYIVTVQRASGKTPHQLRMEAEAENARLVGMAMTANAQKNETERLLMAAREALGDYRELLRNVIGDQLSAGQFMELESKHAAAIAPLVPAESDPS